MKQPHFKQHTASTHTAFVTELLTVISWRLLVPQIISTAAPLVRIMWILQQARCKKTTPTICSATSRHLAKTTRLLDSWTVEALLTSWTV